MEIKRVSIIGLGALGILFGQQMAKNLPHGSSLTFIASPERIERYKREGIFSNDEKCNFTYMEPGQEAPPADLLIFAVKYNGLVQAIEDARGVVGEQTTILSLLNGISSEQLLVEAYGTQKVLYAVAQGMEATKTGNRLFFRNIGLISFGEKDGAPTERVQAIVRFFEQVGIGWETPSNMQHKLWSKFMLNCGVNQAAMVHQTNYGGLQQPGEARNTMLAAMREAMQVAQAEGIPIPEQDIHYWMGVLDKLDPQGTPSMRQDRDAQRPSEVELFAGTVRALGKKHAIPTPVNDSIYSQVAEIESHYGH